MASEERKMRDLRKPVRFLLLLLPLMLTAQMLGIGDAVTQVTLKTKLEKMLTP